MKKRKGGYITTRTVYKAVKKYDHTQFDTFCSDVYEEGFCDGRASVPGTDLSQIMKAIKTVKGIGDKRMLQIQEAVAMLFTETEDMKNE